MPDGGFLIADTRNNRIRLVRHGRITTVAGTGEAGYGGDGGRATDARFDEPKAVESTGGGGFLVADWATTASAWSRWSGHGRWP